MSRHIVRPRGYHRISTQPDRWVTSDGDAVVEWTASLALAALHIPPAWTHVWAAKDPAEPVQATGVDARGRTQYRYSEAAIAAASRNKFRNLLEFATALPMLRSAVHAHLTTATSERPADRFTAAAVRLLDHGLFRVGNERYARENDTYGLTTLRRSQVRLNAPQMLFDFVGKEHVRQHVVVEDWDAAAVLHELLDQPAPSDGPLFGIRDEPGWRVIDSATVNSYLHAYGGGAVTAKVFRTWGATVAAAAVLAGARLVGPTRVRRDLTLVAYDAAARLLGNTPSVARASYVHPDVVRVGSAVAVRDAVQRAIASAGTDDVAAVFQDVGVQTAVLQVLRGQ